MPFEIVPAGTNIDFIGKRQICAGLGHPKPARDVDVDVPRHQVDPGAAIEHREHQREPSVVDTDGCAACGAVARRSDQRLDLDQKRSRPLHQRHNAGPGRPGPTFGEEHAG